MNFNEFGIDPAILRALKEIGYVKPTPIQEKAIPLVLAGRDLFGKMKKKCGLFTEK